MEEFKFNSLKELYQKVLPALSTKVADLKRYNIHQVEEDDIWQYLKHNYWQKCNKLTLGEIVNDILSTPNDELEKYIKDKNKHKKPKKGE